MNNKRKEDTIVKDFELGTILTMILGTNCVDDFNKMWKLVWFVCDDTIGPIGLTFAKDTIKEHLLTIHPELKNITYKPYKNLNEFLLEQEKKFGSVLPITKLGVKLPEEYTIKTSSYVPSSDSEVIAELLDDFEYNPSKTNKVLAKYKRMVWRKN